MRGDQLTRQWKLIALLSGRTGRTLDQIASELGVAKRTIQRDLDVLQASGFPVVSETREGSLWWRLIDQTKSGTVLPFTLQELMALYFSRDLLQALHGSPIQQALDSAIEKIGASLPAPSHDLVRRLRGQTAVSTTGWKDYTRSAGIMRALNQAARHQRMVRITHRPIKATETLTRTVDPYRLWFAGGALYLVAYDHIKSAIRTFAIERVERVTSTNRRFTIQEGFDFATFMRTAFPVHGGEPQLVKIRFSADQAPYVLERHWHDSQKFSLQQDGSLIMELQVASLWEVKRWLIGWGADAEALSPQQLRNEIEHEAAELSCSYGHPGQTQ